MQNPYAWKSKVEAFEIQKAKRSFYRNYIGTVIAWIIG